MKNCRQQKAGNLVIRRGGTPSGTLRPSSRPSTKQSMKMSRSSSRVGSSRSLNDAKAVRATATPGREEIARHEITSNGGSIIYSPDLTTSTKIFRQFIKSFLPFTHEKNSEVDEELIDKRKAAFAACDLKRNGRVSMSQIEVFILVKLKEDHGTELGEEIFNSFAPSYILAYNATKGFKEHVSRDDGDFITFQHFRILTIYLCVYAGMLDAFSRVVGGNDTVSISNGSKNMSESQWIELCEKLTRTGFIIFQNQVHNEGKNRIVEMFTDQNGCVNFHNFCEEIERAEIDAKTLLGQKLNIHKEDTPTRESSPVSNYDAKKPFGNLAEGLKANNENGMRTNGKNTTTRRISFTGEISTSKKLQKRRLGLHREGNIADNEDENQDSRMPSELKMQVHLSSSTKEFENRRSSTMVIDKMVSSFKAPASLKSNCNPKDIEFLSEEARLALYDFSDHLQILNKDALDEEGFNTILDDIGYCHDRRGLFDALLEEVSAANISATTEGSIPVVRREISLDDMLALYGTEPYHLLNNADVTGDELMKYIDDIFDELDSDDNGCLDKAEVTMLLERLIGHPPTDEQVFALFDMLDADKSGTIDREEFKDIVMKQNKVQDLDFIENFNYNLFDPALFGIDDFISELEKYCLKHTAVNHHFLQNLGGATFGKEETVDLIARFFAALSHVDCSLLAQRLCNLLHRPIHKNLLQYHLNERMGLYGKRKISHFESKGIKRETIENVSHSQLFISMIDKLERKIRCSYRKFVPDRIISIERDALEEIAADGIIGEIAALYFGTELILPKMYELFLQGLKNSYDTSNDDVAFLVLRSETDKVFLRTIRNILVDNCNTREDRISLFKNTDTILRARVRFYDTMRDQYDFHDSRLSVTDFYNRKAKSWKREEPNFLEDFTAIPTVFDMCGEHIVGSTVVDIGCGEGYASRHLKSLGARKLIGVDVSEKMIECAEKSARKGPEEYYIVGDAVELRKTLLSHSAELKLMVGAQFNLGIFDLAVAIQLFNTMSISDMNRTMKHIYSLLKPGGHLVFSVPHPFQGDKMKGYFSMCDKQLKYRTKSLRTDEFDSWNYFKAFQDYINAAMASGFDVVELKEATVSPGDLLKSPQFFSHFMDRPLFLVMKVCKPNCTPKAATMNTISSIDLLPKKVIWNRTLMKNIPKAIEITLPETVNIEVCDAALNCFQRGLTADDVEIGRDVDPSQFTKLKSFCKKVRAKLLHQTGVVIVKGLAMDKFCDTDDLGKTTACSKIAYYLICGHIGRVDGGTWGRLFDVKNSIDKEPKDEIDEKAHFSFSDCEAGWHTDGCSKDKVNDVVGLMCISPAAKGGEFRFANACNVYDDISKAMPKFLMYEMTRSIPRDNPEEIGGLESMMRQASDVQALRIRYNSYPIYATEGERMRFRYMRHLIETGHMKTKWKVPTLLRIAMDILDDKLNEACVFHEALGRGDMIFTNNAMLAHARDPFENDPNKPPRHKVRAWLQIQKADIYSPESEVLERDLNEILRQSQRWTTENKMRTIPQ